MTLVSGPVDLKAPLGVKLVPVVSAKDMFDAVTSVSEQQDAIIKAAAVADYRPAVVGAEKTKESDGNMNIELERTDDILAWLGAHRRAGQVLCGFSMETQNMLENSQAKLAKKKVDMIVANSLRTAGAGFGTDTNIVTVITKDGAEELELMSKDAVAHELLNRIFHMARESYQSNACLVNCKFAGKNKADRFRTLSPYIHSEISDVQYRTEDKLFSNITEEIKKRRTFAIISHPDAGKTTLTEKFLLYGGAINLAGTVKGRKAAKHAVSDWMEIGKERYFRNLICYAV